MFHVQSSRTFFALLVPLDLRVALADHRGVVHEVPEQPPKEDAVAHDHDVVPRVQLDLVHELADPLLDLLLPLFFAAPPLLLHLRQVEVHLVHARQARAQVRAVVCVFPAFLEVFTNN